jgi:hypothetical protein
VTASAGLRKLATAQMPHQKIRLTCILTVVRFLPKHISGH